MAASVYSELKTRIDAINKDFREGYQASKASHKRMDWLSWLVKESRQGNNEALDVLRARKIIVRRQIMSLVHRLMTIL